MFHALHILTLLWRVKSVEEGVFKDEWEECSSKTVL